jgi:hypothetical protein
VPVEFLCDEQAARFGRFVAEPSPLELRCFRLDAGALRLIGEKRRDENRLGFGVQWGTVRMLGTFLSEDPTAVPAGVGGVCRRAASDHGALVLADVCGASADRV